MRVSTLTRPRDSGPGTRSPRRNAARPSGSTMPRPVEADAVGSDV